MSPTEAMAGSTEFYPAILLLLFIVPALGKILTVFINVISILYHFLLFTHMEFLFDARVITFDIDRWVSIWL